MATRLAGYRRRPGLSRRYLTPEGAEISYREYRSRLELQGEVKRLGAVELANARRRQREFNDIIRQMAKVRAQSLDIAIENTEAAMERLQEQYDEGLLDIDEFELEQDLEELAERLAMHRRVRRRVKSEAIRSPARKEAIETLRETSADRVTRAGVRRYKSPADEQRAKEALIALGRRQGVPDYVPVGYSDKKRSWGRFKRAAR